MGKANQASISQRSFRAFLDQLPQLNGSQFEYLLTSTVAIRRARVPDRNQSASRARSQLSALWQNVPATMGPNANPNGRDSCVPTSPWFSACPGWSQEVSRTSAKISFPAREESSSVLTGSSSNMIPSKERTSYCCFVAAGAERSHRYTDSFTSAHTANSLIQSIPIAHT